MPLIATLRDSDGAVLCAYKMKAAQKSDEKFDFTGETVIEVGARQWVVHTIIKECTFEDWEAQGHMPCSECGAPVPFPGWDTWTTCPACGAKVRPTHLIVGSEGETA